MELPYNNPGKESEKEKYMYTRKTESLCSPIETKYTIFKSIMCHLKLSNKNL